MEFSTALPIFSDVPPSNGLENKLPDTVVSPVGERWSNPPPRPIFNANIQPKLTANNEDAQDVNFGTIQDIENELKETPIEAKPPINDTNTKTDDKKGNNNDDKFLTDDLSVELGITIIDIFGSSLLSILAKEKDTTAFELSNKQKQDLTRLVKLVVDKRNIRITPETALLLKLLSYYGQLTYDAYQMRIKNEEIADLKKQLAEERNKSYNNTNNQQTIQNFWDGVIPERQNRFVFQNNESTDEDTNTITKTITVIDKPNSAISPPIALNTNTPITWIQLAKESSYDYENETIEYIDTENKLCLVTCHMFKDQYRYKPLITKKDPSQRKVLQRCHLTGQIFERLAIHKRSIFISSEARQRFNNILKNSQNA